MCRRSGTTGKTRTITRAELFSDSEKRQAVPFRAGEERLFVSKPSMQTELPHSGREGRLRALSAQWTGSPEAKPHIQSKEPGIFFGLPLSNGWLK